MPSSEIRELRFEIDQLRRLVTKQIARISQYPMPPSGVQIIRFTVISANCPSKTAEVQIDAYVCGKSSASGEDEYGQVTVHDPNECNITADTEEGDKGWAVLMAGGYEGECRWEVLDICCGNVC